MSCHYLDLVIDGNPVKLQIGWDRPLQGYYMVVSRVSEVSGGEDDGYLYSNLANDDSHPRVLDPYLDWLRDKGVILPERLIEELVEDGDSNAGNKSVQHQVVNGVYSRMEGFP